MVISENSWVEYIDKLRAISDEAAEKFLENYRRVRNPFSEAGRKGLQWYAFIIGRDYGEAAASLACEMYDSMIVASGMDMGRPVGWIEPAVPAETVTLAEAGKTVNGVLKVSQNEDMLANAVSRLVKMAGVDTVLKNAVRDKDSGAQFAWIPHGDTCPYCIAIASRGWRKASAKALRDGHAEHIHSNCDCTYAVRFNDDTEIEGYDEDAIESYRQQYEAGKKAAYDDKGNSHTTKKQTESRKIMNGMYREYRRENREKINEQKRIAYRERKEREEQ